MRLSFPTHSVYVEHATPDYDSAPEHCATRPERAISTNLLAITLESQIKLTEPSGLERDEHVHCVKVQRFNRTSLA